MASARKKKKYLRLFILISVTAAAAFLFFMGYLLWQTRRLENVKYPEFGIAIPNDYQIHGIDVSKYQRMIAWDAVKEMSVGNIRLGFAFIKATEGNSNTDPFFKRNWKKTRDAGIIRGAYHFFIPTKDGRRQAENFTEEVELETGDLPPVLDVEQAGSVAAVNLRKEIQEWLDICEEYYHVKPIIYTNVEFYTRYLKGYFDAYPLWVAHYLQPKQPRISRNWSFWQHSEEGRVNGILSKVDFNVFNGDSASFRALLVP